MRSDGFAVALDAVGAHPDSMAHLDVVAPDIIKLGIDLVQSRLSNHGALTVAGVLADQERTGAVILAEGVETDAHLERALAVGATLWSGIPVRMPPRRCRPAPRPPGGRCPGYAPVVNRRCSGSPFDAVRGHSPVRTARRSTVLALCHHVESLASPAFDPPILLTAMQHDRHFGETTRDRYRRLAEGSALVAVFGQQLPQQLAPGIRGVPLAAADPPRDQWAVIALGPHISAARPPANNPVRPAERRSAFRHGPDLRPQKSHRR